MPTFSLIVSFVKFELLKGQPEAFFLMSNGSLSFDELLLFQFDPLCVKPEAFLYLKHVAMEVLEEENLFLMSDPRGV